ncbi:MAG: MotA/TolQ/ExbB proton channel family protein [Chlamydiia bacterium]|nr:MotA/TolQ/ExbB proton channel family protein [Chlamydiia bacterium]
MSNWFQVGFQLFGEWNLFALLLGALGVFVVALFFERLFVFRRATHAPHDLLSEIEKALERRSIVDAIQICEESGGVISSTLKAGLLRHEASEASIERAMNIAQRYEVIALERNLRGFSMIAQGAPLIGLIGASAGLFQAFDLFRQTGFIDLTNASLGTAIQSALLCAVAGLLVALPAQLLYQFFLGKIETLLSEIELVCAEVLDLLQENR